MISSNTRATRSRFSSPAQQTQPQTQPATTSAPLEVSKSSGNDASRSFMQRWLEPSVQSKTSYQEAGLIRYGVVEGMAPLGTLPKARKGGNDIGTGVRKIILKPPPANKDDSDAAEFKPKTAKRRAGTPSGTGKGPRSRKSLPAKASKSSDEEFTDGPRRRNPRRVSVPPKQAQALAQDEQDESRIERESSPVAQKPATPQRAHKSSIDGKNFTGKVVDVAVDEALKHYRYPTAWALRTLYDENSGDADFESMVSDVFNQTADVDTLDAFNRQIEDKKREGKRDNQGCYYFVPPSTNSRFTPHKPKQAPYAKLLVTTDDEDEVPVAKKAKLSHVEDTLEEMAANGIKIEEDEGNHVMETPSRKRRRRSSESSDSSLSPAQSLPSPEVRLSSLSPTLRKGRGATRAGATSQDAPAPQPITSRDKSTKHIASNAAHPNSAPSHKIHPNPNTAHGSMPGRLAASELFPSLKSGSGEPGPIDEVRASPVHHEDDDSVWKRRKNAQQVTNGYVAAESSMRRGTARPAASTPVKKSRRTRRSMAAPTSTRSTRSATKQTNDDGNRTVSPVPFSLRGDGSSAAGSRAVTPSASRQGKKPKGGLRVKSS